MTDAGALYLKFKADFQIPYVRTRNPDGSIGVEPDPNTVQPTADLGLDGDGTGLVTWDDGTKQYGIRPVETAYSDAATLKAARILSQQALESGFIRKAVADTIIAAHTFNNEIPDGPPFVIGPNSEGVPVPGLNSQMLGGYTLNEVLNIANHVGAQKHVIATAANVVGSVSASNIIQWSATTTEVGEFWSIDNQPAQFRAPDTGLYLVLASAQIGNCPAGTKAVMTFSSNSAIGLFASNSQTPDSDNVSIVNSVSAVGLYFLNAGQWVLTTIARDNPPTAIDYNSIRGAMVQLSRAA